MNNLQEIKGLGPKKEKLLNSIGIYSKLDLIKYIPFDYLDLRKIYTPSTQNIDSTICLKVKIMSIGKTSFFKGKNRTKLVSLCDDIQIDLIYFNDRFTPRSFVLGEEYYLYGKLKFNNNRYLLNNPKKIEEANLKIIPKYRTKKGLNQKDIYKFIIECLNDIDISESLPSKLIKKYNFQSNYETYKNLHLPDNFENIIKSRKRLNYEAYLYNLLSYKYFNFSSKKIKNSLINVDKKKLEVFLSNLEFNLTKYQQKVLNDIIKDLESNFSMNRLIQGDVGSGKTIIGIIASYLVLESGFDCVFIGPTETLITQHYNNYKNLFLLVFFL